MNAPSATMLRWLPVRLRWALSGRGAGLQVRIALLVSTGLLIMIALFVVLGVSAVRDSTERDLRGRESLAQMAAAHLDFVMSQTATTLQWTASRLAPALEGGDARAARAILRDAAATASGDLLLLDAQGEPWLAEPATLEFSYPQLSTAARRDLEGGAAFAVDAVRSLEGTYALVVVPVETGAGFLAGSVYLHDPTMRHWLAQIAPGESGQVDLVDWDGRVLMSTAGGSMVEPEGHAGYYAGLMSEGATVVTTCYNCHATPEGTDRRPDVMVFSPLKTVSWGVVLREAEADVLDPTRRLQRQVLILGGVSLLVAMLAVWLTTRGVVGPIRALTASARGIADGRLDHPVSIQASGEVAELAAALDHMRKRLQLSMEEIRQCNLELEQRVRDRTVELERSRDDLAASLERLHRLIERVSALNAMAVSLNQPSGPDGFLEGALVNAIKLSGMEAGAIYLLNEQSGDLTLATHHGMEQDTVRDCANFGLSASSCAAAARAGKQLVIVDVAGSTGAELAHLRREGIHTLARVPFKASDQFLGTMCLAARAPRVLSREEVDLLVSISSQMAVAVQNSRLYRELQSKERMRGELLKRVITAQEDERKRIARELHDQTSQALAALSMAVETAIAQARAGGDVTASLLPMRELTLNTLEEIHRLIFDLRPTLLDDLGLVAAIRWYAEERLGQLGMKVRVEVAGDERRLAPEVESALYRVVQETVNNVASHSGAGRFTITLVWRPRLLSLLMADDGEGFDLEELARTRDRKRGLGLMGMYERVDLLGGSFAIDSAPGRGTKVTVAVPLTPEVEGKDA